MHAAREESTCMQHLDEDVDSSAATVAGVQEKWLVIATSPRCPRMPAEKRTCARSTNIQSAYASRETRRKASIQLTTPSN
jgi:hypothetical protein